jgi:hypothetical protein
MLTNLLIEVRLGRSSAMASANTRWHAISLCAWVFIVLAACQKAQPDDISWAQRALERNPQLQVVAVDRSARAFTVRLKDTGELRMVQADDVVGSVPSVAPAATPVTAANTAVPETPASAAPAPASPAVGAQDSAAAPEPKVAAGLTATNSGPGVIAAGPGYSIKSARSDAAANARPGGFAQTDTIARGLALERRDEPIVCQGSRFLRIDSRNLEFAGDAISAEDGCEIHITNSRIAAKGVGISARAANVHIENSSIEGQSGSILASDGAQVYAEASRFRGVSRGLNSETLHDLGGNVWN